MINIFFDCEFTKLQQESDSESNELISIGCISDNGKHFYAENSDVLSRPDSFSEFVIEVVIPLLEGGNSQVPYENMANNLRIWIESFDSKVKMWTDAAAYDWPHIERMFDSYGWPENLIRKPITLSFPNSIQQTRFFAGVEDAFKTFQPKLRRHHALDDAIANKYGFKRATARKY
jgi:hypothetical protein